MLSRRWLAVPGAVVFLFSATTAATRAYAEHPYSKQVTATFRDSSGRAQADGSIFDPNGRRLVTDYRIYKRYYTGLLAAPDAAARAASSQKPVALVLRYGIGRADGSGWGLNHLKQRHHWSQALDSALEFMASDPNASVKERGNSNTYSWFDEYEHDGELCIVEAGEDRNPLADHEEKGIISATLECGVDVFSSYSVDQRMAVFIGKWGRRTSSTGWTARSTVSRGAWAGSAAWRRATAGRGDSAVSGLTSSWLG
jgi:hypothetical protein